MPPSTGPRPEKRQAQDKLEEVLKGFLPDGFALDSQGNDAERRLRGDLEGVKGMSFAEINKVIRMLESLKRALDASA